MYHWEFNDELVEEQYEALPTEAGFVFLDVMNDLVRDPFAYVARAAGAEESHGHATSGGVVAFAGDGQIAVQVYEIDEVVLVRMIQWLGG